MAGPWTRLVQTEAPVGAFPWLPATSPGCHYQGDEPTGVFVLGSAYTVAKYKIFPLLIDAWLSGTRRLTWEEKGIYLELCLHLFQEGGTIKNEAHAARILGMNPRTFRRNWPRIRAKFRSNSSGIYHELVSQIRNNQGRIKGLEYGSRGGSTPPTDLGIGSKKENSVLRTEQKKVGGVNNSRGGVKKFRKPTEAEVQAYLDERGITEFTGQEFCDNNDAKGWVVGKNRTPMKDWRAVVRTWESNGKKRQAEKDSERDKPIRGTADWYDQRARERIAKLDAGATGEFLEGDAPVVRTSMVPGPRGKLIAD